MLWSLTRRTMVAITLVVIFLMVVSPALAQKGDDNGNSNGNGDGNGRGNGGADHVPEIDPSSAVSAIILLTGGTMLLVDSRRRKKQR